MATTEHIEHEEPRRPARPEGPGEQTDSSRPAPRAKARMDPRAALALQRRAGNRAVAGLLTQPARPSPAEPAKAEPTAESAGSTTEPASDQPSTVIQRRAARPEADPKFAALKSDLTAKQRTLKAHPAPKQAAGAAQAAAVPPQDDKLAQAKAAQAGEMAAAKPGGFDKAAFVKAVQDAIAAQAPKNLDEADNFASSGKADAVKGQVSGQVKAGAEGTAGNLKAATAAAPDTSKATDKPVAPLRPDQPPPAPGAPAPGRAVPDPVPASATDLSAGPKQVDAQMAEAQVTEDQLARSNEPQFTDALGAKREGEAQAATAPGRIRTAEDQTLDTAKAAAGQAGATAMSGMATDRRTAGAQVGQGQQGAKGRDEARRAQVTARLQTVFDTTKKDVEAILSGLDGKVDQAFTKQEKAARDAFTAEHHRKMAAYKDERYSGFTGKLRWVKDKFAGLPAEANQIFVAARAGYVARMQGVISNIADLIGGELNRAKARIATGRTDLQAEVAKLPADLRQIGQQAAGEFAGKFDALGEQVDAKGTELVNTLASKYSEALNAVDAEIDKEKAANKGLIAKAVDAVAGVIKTIIELKNMLMGVLAKAASAIAAIIKDPIGFLGKLVHAVGAGLQAFLANIGTHLKKGLVGWLMGAMTSAGLELPARWDLKGIFGMIAGLLGLTWQFIRGRIVAKGVPEQAMSTVEQSVPLAQKVASGGIGALWEEVKEKLGDLKDNLFGKIMDFLIPSVLIAGITWIISLLNPASAFVKAVKMIIDIVTFIVTRGAQIIEFVNSVLDAVIAIAGGAGGGVPQLVEAALAKSVPVLIGALAAILGIGGVADKVKGLVQSLAKPVKKAVDWVVEKIVGLGKKVWAKLKGRSGSAGEDTAAAKQKRLDAGMSAATRILGRFAGRTVGERLLKPLLAGVRLRYRMTSLTLFSENGVWGVEGVVNPKDRKLGSAKSSSPAGLDGLQKVHQVAVNKINNVLKKAWNNNTVKKKLAADAHAKQPLEREYNRLTRAMQGRTEAAYQALINGQETSAEVPKMFDMYRQHLDAADHLVDQLEDLRKSPAELEEGAAKARSDISKMHSESAAVVARPEIRALLALPVESVLAGRLNNRLTAVGAALPRLATMSLNELRPLALTARGLRQDAQVADTLSDVSKGIGPDITKIDQICLNTTKDGKDGADVGDGTSEDAAKEEARTARPVKNKAHGPKCRMEAAGLRKAIERLRAMRTLTTDAALHSRIDAAIAKAQERATKLDSGAAAWDGRMRADPDQKIWNPDGTSKVVAGFGKGI